MPQRGYPEVVFSFGPFRLFRDRKLLLREGLPVRLGGRATDLLIALVERAGEVVTRDQLVGLVWPTTFVDDSNLRVHIGMLRKALGDGHDGERYILNVSGRGYCFAAPAVREGEIEGAPFPIIDAPSGWPAMLTSMVGREQLLTDIVERIALNKVLTIVGPGGVGKSTLGLAAAEKASAAHGYPRRYIDLAAVDKNEDVFKAICTALGVSPRRDAELESLVASLRGAWMLVVLDNCEHVAPAAAEFVDKILASAPGVRVLATSREPLRTRLEALCRLEPLAVPESIDGLSPAEALAYPSVQLFVERAIGAMDTFDARDDQVLLIANICRRLDGLPLAIELAAARIDLFGLKGLERALDEQLLMSADGNRNAAARQRSLSATLDWSFNLLSPTERRILCDLSIFRGWFTAEAALAVAGADEIEPSGMSAVLVSLAERSLVVTQVRDSTVLWRLLFVTRAFAGQQSQSEDGANPVAARHAAYFRTYFQRAQQTWTTTDRRDWLAAHDHTIDDVRAALDWAYSESGDPHLAAALTVAALPFGLKLAQTAEFKSRAERALALLSTTSADDATSRVRLACTLCSLQMSETTDANDMREAFEQLIRLCGEVADPRFVIQPLNVTALYCIEIGDYAVASSVMRQLADAAGASKDPLALLEADRIAAWVTHFSGHGDKALQLADRVERHPSPSIPLLYHRGALDRRLGMQVIRARILWLQGKSAEALDLIYDCLATAVKDSPAAASHVLALGACPIALWAGDRRADELVSDLEDLKGQHGLERWALLGEYFRSALDRRAVGPDQVRLAPRRPATANVMHHELLVTVDAAFVDNALIVRADAGACGWCGPEILRAAGLRILADRRPSASDDAQLMFERALELAREQRALAWEIRAATTLADHWRKHDRIADAKSLMARTLAGIGTNDATRDVVIASQLAGSLEVQTATTA